MSKSYRGEMDKIRAAITDAGEALTFAQMVQITGLTVSPARQALLLLVRNGQVEHVGSSATHSKTYALTATSTD